jgi:AcrR family transcriptional regulator
MSNSAINIHARRDPRIARTRTLLADALMGLGAEKPIEAIDVGTLVDEAGISRSTFYEHFASKDDFLVRSFVDMLAGTEAAFAAAYPERTDLFASKPVFAHVGGAKDFVRSLIKSDVFHRQMAAGEVRLRAIVEANLERLKPELTAERRSETAVYVAAGFIGLLRWWMQGGLNKTPEEMQAAFERLSRSAMADA